MNTTLRRRLRNCGLGAATLLAFVSCNEDRTAEFKKLNEELETARDNYNNQVEIGNQRDEKLKSAKKEVAELKAQLKSAEKQLRNAERELDRLRSKEAAAQEAADAEPDPKETRAAARETIAGSRESMVEISGDATKGSGILVATNGKTWIYCDRGTIENNTRIEVRTTGGTELKRFGAFEVAAGVPLVRLEVLGEEIAGIPLPAEAVDVPASTALLSFNAEGGLVEGRIYGETGGTTLPVDNRFASCPVGSPVFSGESAALIGMIVSADAETMELWPDTRRGLRGPEKKIARLGGKMEWTAAPIGTFLEEARLLKQTHKLARLAHAFAATTANSTGITYGSLGGGLRTEDLLEENKKLPVVMALRELDTWLKEKGARSSATDINKKINGVYRQMTTMTQRQTKELKDRRFSPPHAEAASRSLEWLEEARKELATRIGDRQ